MKILSIAIQLAFLLCIGWVNEHLAQSCGGRYYLPSGTSNAFRYTRSYVRGQTCQINLSTDPNNIIVAQCNTSMPDTTQCSVDRLDVARSGVSTLNTDQRYCGSRTFVTNSYSERLTLTQISPASNNPYNGGSYSCLFWTQRGCTCGTTANSRIVGGFVSGKGANPSAVALVSRSTGLVCGGTIIDSNAIVTAQHCVQNANLNDFYILTGASSIPPNNDPYSATYGIQSVTGHPSYNPNTYENDIAILTTTTPISYNPRTSPACLDPRLSNYNFNNQNVTIWGYGTQSFGGAKTNQLKQASVRVTDRNTCNNLGYSRGLRFSENQLCTTSATNDGCQFDSGGGDTWVDPVTGLYYLIGILSYGYGCASSYPSGSTYVPNYTTFINQTLPGNTICNFRGN